MNYLKWLNGSYEISEPYHFTDDTFIDLTGDVYVKLTASADIMLRADQQLVVRGGRLILDAAGLTSKAVVWNLNKGPDIENIEVRNGPTGGFILSSDINNVGGGLQVTGDARYERCVVTDCGSGYLLYGHNPVLNQSLTMIDCETRGTTGHYMHPSLNQHRVLFARNFGRVDFRGGIWEGDSRGLFTNAFQCKNVDINGGYYHGINNGPNINNQCELYTVRGAIVDGVIDVGVHCDTKNPLPGTVADYGKVIGCSVRNSGTGYRMTGDRYSVVGNSAYDCGTYYRFVEKPLDVWVDGNLAYSSGSTHYIAYWVQPTTAGVGNVRFGTNVSNSTHPGAITAPSTVGMRADLGQVREVSANATLTGLDEDILVRADEAPIILSLPDCAGRNLHGKGWKVIRHTGQNTITISAQGGTINGLPSISVSGAVEVRQYANGVFHAWNLEKAL